MRRRKSKSKQTSDELDDDDSELKRTRCLPTFGDPFRPLVRILILFFWYLFADQDGVCPFNLALSVLSAIFSVLIELLVGCAAVIRRKPVKGVWWLLPVAVWLVAMYSFTTTITECSDRVRGRFCSRLSLESTAPAESLDSRPNPVFEQLVDRHPLMPAKLLDEFFSDWPPRLFYLEPFSVVAGADNDNAGFYNVPSESLNVFDDQAYLFWMRRSPSWQLTRLLASGQLLWRLGQEDSRRIHQGSVLGDVGPFALFSFVGDGGAGLAIFDAATGHRLNKEDTVLFVVDSDDEGGGGGDKEGCHELFQQQQEIRLVRWIRTSTFLFVLFSPASRLDQYFVQLGVEQAEEDGSRPPQLTCRARWTFPANTFTAFPAAEILGFSPQQLHVWLLVASRSRGGMGGRRGSVVSIATGEGKGARGDGGASNSCFSSSSFEMRLSVNDTFDLQHLRPANGPRSDGSRRLCSTCQGDRVFGLSLHRTLSRIVEFSWKRRQQENSCATGTRNHGSVNSSQLVEFDDLVAVSTVHRDATSPARSFVVCSDNFLVRLFDSYAFSRAVDALAVVVADACESDDLTHHRGGDGGVQETGNNVTPLPPSSPVDNRLYNLHGRRQFIGVVHDMLVFKRDQQLETYDVATESLHMLIGQPRPPLTPSFADVQVTVNAWGLLATGTGANATSRLFVTQQNSTVHVACTGELSFRCAMNRCCCPVSATTSQSFALDIYPPAIDWKLKQRPAINIVRRRPFASASSNFIVTGDAGQKKKHVFSSAAPALWYITVLLLLVVYI